MKQAIKMVGCIGGLFVLSLAVGLALYDLLHFRPHIEQIRQVIAHADSEDRTPPPIICNLVELGNGPTPFVAREMLRRFGLPRQNGNLNRHLRSALWHLLVRLHFSDIEITCLYISISFNGKDYGLNRLARRLYSKPLSQANSIEAATLLAIIRAPTRFVSESDGSLRNTEQLHALRDQWLADLAAAK